MATINTDPNKEVLDAIDAMFARVNVISPFNEMGGVLAVDVPQEMVPQNGQIQPLGYLEEDSVTSEVIADGAVTPESFDTTPPAVPTDLALDSEVVASPDGSLVLRLIASLTQPSDTDLYASFVQVTAQESSPGVPDWDRPILLQIGNTQDEASIEGVAGTTLYYARAYSVDIQGNQSAFTSTVSHTTAADADAPTIPQDMNLTPGFKGFIVSWSAGNAPDLAVYEVRFAVDDGTGTAPLVDSFTKLQTKSTVVFVSGLTADTLYWVQVRAVDLSGNVRTSLLDDTAVNYIATPDAGWSDIDSVTPTLIGETDVAANSITAVHIRAGSLSADDIGAGTLTISPLDGFAEGILILGASSEVLGRWDENGLKIVDPTDPSRYVLFDSGELKFTTDDGVTFPTAVTPEGINASAINFGTAPGGHNLILNSSYELADFVAVGSTFTFTDTTNWAAANRPTTFDNITEGTSLTITSAGF